MSTTPEGGSTLLEELAEAISWVECDDEACQKRPESCPQMRLAARLRARAEHVRRMLEASQEGGDLWSDNPGVLLHRLVGPLPPPSQRDPEMRCTCPPVTDHGKDGISAGFHQQGCPLAEASGYRWYVSRGNCPNHGPEGMCNECAVPQRDPEGSAK